MDRIRVLIIFILSSISQSEAFCPHKCVCDNEQLQVTCFQTKLEVRISILFRYSGLLTLMFQVMPMTLNPSIRTLILKYNDFHSVDASFNFYPELELVDQGEGDDGSDAGYCHDDSLRGVYAAPRSQGCSVPRRPGGAQQRSQVRWRPAGQG